MRPYIAVPWTLGIVLAGPLCLGAIMGPNERAPTPNWDVKELLSPDKGARWDLLDNLGSVYGRTATQIMAALGDALQDHRNDRTYRSPLHCAILAVYAWHVLRADANLLTIVDYELDIRSVPPGAELRGEDLYPAAAALVELRVDTRKVSDAIKASTDSRELGPLTWVLLKRADGAAPAKAILTEAKKMSNSKEAANLTAAIEILDLDAYEVLRYKP